MAEVVCIGYACTDVFIRGIELHTPFEGEVKPCDSMMLAIGGDAANESIVMGRMGVDVKLVAGAGKDMAATLLCTTLEKAGVDMSGLHVVPGSETPMTGVVVHEDGQRNFIMTKGYPESVLFKPDTKVLEGAKIISLASMFAPPLHKPENIRVVAEYAKKTGAILCADVYCGHGGMDLEKIADVLSCIDYIFPNMEEAEALTGEKEVEKMADVFLDYGVKNVIIKTGKDGCFVKNREECFTSPSIADKVIDTTGAGDNFAAGFITALADGKDLRGCCEFASATAGVACSCVGSNTGVQSKAQVEAFLEKYK